MIILAFIQISAFNIFAPNSAEEKRIRERGVIPLGEGEVFDAPGRVWAPASWQEGYDRYVEILEKEEEIRAEHMEEWGIVKGKDTWKTPFHKERV